MSMIGPKSCIPCQVNKVIRLHKSPIDEMHVPSVPFSHYPGGSGGPLATFLGFNLLSHLCGLDETLA